MATSLRRRTGQEAFPSSEGGVKMWEDPEVEAAWIEEIDRRVKEVAEGRVKTYTASEVMAELRARRAARNQ